MIGDNVLDMKYKIQNIKYTIQYNKGIALFVAVLVSGIVLVIGAGVMNITLKEIKLSSLGRESTQSFYTADTGLECALYWDDIKTTGSPSSIFATSSASTLPSSSNCINTDITASSWVVVSNTNAATTTFTLQFTADVNDPCVTVLVAKYKDINGITRTTIDSRGINSCNINRINRVERGIRLSY